MFVENILGRPIVRQALLVSAAAALLAGPAFAQTVTVDAARLDAIAEELKALRDQNERLAAEVEYLKANAREARKQLATDELTLNTLNATATVAPSRWTWNGDLRYRHEWDEAEERATSRNRERLRLRFGMSAKVNDSVTARVQLSTVNPGTDNYRSLNQNLGSSWDRKQVGFDLAYVDWKATPTINLVAGKMPIPFATTASYFWDKDLTPEGVVLKYVRGPLFANFDYFALSDRDVATSSLASKDADVYAGQLGWKQQVGRVTWTVAGGYFALNGVRDRIISAAGTGCTIDAAFGSGQGTGSNAFGNSTYTGAAIDTAGSSLVCTRLLNDYKMQELLAQADWVAGGRYPVSVFVDYMKNRGVLASAGSNKQDQALSAGFLFNKAGNPRTWEIGYVYQKAEKDGVYSGFHDSDYSGGLTDSEGGVLKLAFVPAAGWTLNAQYFMNRRYIDNTDAVATRKYNRLQLDLNYKY